MLASILICLAALAALRFYPLTAATIVLLFFGYGFVMALQS